MLTPLLAPFALVAATVAGSAPGLGALPRAQDDRSPDKASTGAAETATRPEPGLGTLDGPLRNTVALPAHEAAVAALTAGDQAWGSAQTAEEGDRPGLRTRAFDGWRDALAGSDPGDGVPLALQDVDPTLFPDPDGTHGRRAEGVQAGVLRRLDALAPLDLAAWIERFEGGASAQLERARDLAAAVQAIGGIDSAAAALARVERDHPATDAAARAALACFDLAVEAGQEAAAAAWLDRARTHVALAMRSGRAQRAAVLSAAIGVRRRHLRDAAPTWGFDSTSEQRVAPWMAPMRDLPEPMPPKLLLHQMVIGLGRSTDEPFGRGLESGVAFFADGSVLVQSAHGLLLVESDAEGIAGRRTRALSEELLGIQRPLVHVAPSSGGWPSLPGSDGRVAAIVVGRAERPRNFMDIEVPPNGNVLALVRRGAADRPLDPAWVLRDGIVVLDPAAQRRTVSGARGEERLRPLERLSRAREGGRAAGWDIGRGWEFQPGPVVQDGRIFLLARGLGDVTDEGSDHADEVRLIALDASNAAVVWSRVLTNERGLQDPRRRGDGGYLAATTMPLALDRTTGTLLVGTNVGLVAAYGAAEGRLLWMARTQRRTPGDDTSTGGWPGTRAPLVVRTATGRSTPPEGGGVTAQVSAADSGTVWFAPFDSEFAYALPAGPAPLDGSLLRESPRARRGALDLAAALPGRADGAGRDRQGSTLLLLGRDGRYEALLVEAPDGRRQPSAYLSPDERFTGPAALLDGGGPGQLAGLAVAGSHELAVLDRRTGYSLRTAAPLPDLGVGRGGGAVTRGGRIYIVGRDAVWIFERP